NCPPLCRPPNIDAQLQGRSEACGDVLPVPEIPGVFEKFGFPILILKVVGVFPCIEHHQRNTPLSEIGLMIVDLSNEKSFADGLPDERRPSRSHDCRSHLVELFMKVRESAEVSLNRAGE